MATLERIKKLCKDHGISVSVLEDRLNFPNNTLYQWKSRTPSLERLEQVANYFNVSTDYLLGRTDKKYIDDIETIAAHHDGEDWTDEELEEIEKFKEFVRMKRSQQE